MSDKNCVDCVFNITDPDKQIELIGQAIDSGICGKGKGPTSLPFPTPKSARTTGEAKAKSCNSFSLPHDAYHEPIILNDDLNTAPIVTLPDPDKMHTNDLSVPDRMKNCLSCANYIKPAASVDAGLWNAGMCRARGIMILPRMPLTLAPDCADFTVGIQDSSSISRMILMPEYTLEAQVNSASQSVVRSIVNPQDYVTDADVSDEDKALGIKAWREVGDPEGKAVVMLPIFDHASFEPKQAQLIPMEGDDEHPEEYIDHQGLVYRAAVLWMQLDETPALWGVAGTGKTEFYRHMAWLMGLPFHRISVTASTEVEDLAGKMHFSPEEGTYFSYGRIPNAWQSPGVVCLDEPNVGPSDVWQFIRPLTDNSKQLVLDMNNGERVKRHQHAYLGMAMNPDWDVRNTGAERLADADGSRLMHIYVELPSEEVEREIIKTRCKTDGYDIDNDDLSTIMKIAKDVRDMCNNETLPITWGVRQQIKVARATKWFEFNTAYKLAAADYMEPAHQELIKDVVKAHTKTGLFKSRINHAPENPYETKEF